MVTKVKNEKEAEKQALFMVDSERKEIMASFVEALKTDIKDEIIEYSMDLYDKLLNGRALPKSRIRSEKYQDEFKEQMELYEYVTVADDFTVLVNFPDMEDFNFSYGSLRCLETILEGVFSTKYVEINGEEWVSMYNKIPITLKPFDSSVPLKKQIYIVKDTKLLQNDAREKNITLTPYSYVKSYDLFGPIEEFIFDKTDEWFEINV